MYHSLDATRNKNFLTILCFLWELTKPHSLTMFLGNLNLLCNSRYVVWIQASFHKMINLFPNVIVTCDIK